MKITEVISKSLSIATKSASLLTLIFIFNAVWSFGTMPFLGDIQNVKPEDVKLNPLLLVLVAVFIFINIFIQGGILGVLKDAITSNNKTALGNFAKYGIRFYLKFISLGLILILFIGLTVLVIGGVVAISIVAKNIIVNIITVSIAIVLMALALYYLFLFFLAPYSLVIDDSGIFKAMKNSMQFVKKHIWGLTGLSTLLVLIAFGMAFFVGVFGGLLSLVVKGDVSLVILNIISSVVNAYITIFISSGLMIYYVTLSDTIQKKETQETLSAAV